MNIGSTIKDLRQKKGLKQLDLAALCDITPSYLSQIEKNIREPNMSTLKIIAEKLDIPLPFLMFLSIEEEDVKEEKREAFKLILPSIKDLVNSLGNAT
jgi:transcriptional regulator with XRE-family HTH domain